jgi:hypothetical protein
MKVDEMSTVRIAVVGGGVAGRRAPGGNSIVGFLGPA